MVQKSILTREDFEIIQNVSLCMYPPSGSIYASEQNVLNIIGIHDSIRYYNNSRNQFT